MLKSLNNIIDDVKRKPYDLLDYTKNAFDRDFLEFNVNINDLELQLQVGAHFRHAAVCSWHPEAQYPGALCSLQHASAVGGKFCACCAADRLRLNSCARLTHPGASGTHLRAS